MIIDLNVKYQTRSGRDVKLFTVTRNNDIAPVLGLIDNTVVDMWTAGGHSVTDSSNDLVEVESGIDWSQVPIDTPILVRDCEHDSWTRRYFSGLDSIARVTTWMDGATSWTAGGYQIAWQYAKLAEET